ncbi:MAG: septal ring lytic transglycosylase RlpA family protein [Terriglobales bacterium]|jgi:rare lipoprotein A
MRRRLAEGLAVILSVASLRAGAASGPSSLEAAKVTQPLVSMTSAQSTRRANNSKPKFPTRQARAYQVGTASWYGEKFQGKQTASGEPYDMRDFTAAHPSLPLGTFVKVTNLRNGKSVVVRINDRGPVVDGRIIDVSDNAARVLGFRESGVQRVRVDLYQSTNYRTTNVALLQPLANLN